MKKFSQGYSLVEIMVVLTLFSVLALVATQTLVLSLRGAQKSESIARVRENLEYVTSVMERQLRNAQSVAFCEPGVAYTTPQNILYTDTKGVSTTFTCNPGVDGYIASGAIRLTNTNVSITECVFNCTQSAGSSQSVEIMLTAEDKSSLPGAEKAKATTNTRILLRQF